MVMKWTEAALEARGFDVIRPEVAAGSGTIRVGCSQCAVVVINGTPTHENGCPNATHECHGCNAIVVRRVRYCEDCQ